VTTVPASSVRPLLLLALTVLVWGYNWVPLKIAAVAVDPYWLSAWRVAGGAATLFAVLALSRRSAAPPPGRAYLGIGLTQVAGLVIFSTLALRFGGVATVTALIFTMPLWTAIFAYLLLGERLSRARVAWLLLACAGIALIASEVRTPGEVAGALCATAGGASWALGNVLQRRAAYQIDSVRLVAWQQLAAAVPLVLLATAFGRFEAQLSAGVIVASVFAAVVGSGIAWLWWGMVLRALPANTVALASFAIPVVAALSAWAQLGTPPAPLTAIGLTIVVAGLAGSVLAYSKRNALIGSSAAALRAGQ
jgi:drug/metabolite transporter (DMT)-like permease